MSKKVSRKYRRALTYQERLQNLLLFFLRFYLSIFPLVLLASLVASVLIAYFTKNVGAGGIIIAVSVCFLSVFKLLLSRLSQEQHITHAPSRIISARSKANDNSGT